MTEFDPDAIVRNSAATLSALARLVNSVMLDVSRDGKISVETRMRMGDGVAAVMRNVKQEKQDGDSSEDDGGQDRGNPGAQRI